MKYKASDFKVGQKVYLLIKEGSNAYRGMYGMDKDDINNRVVEDIVKSVSKKYVKTDRECTFSIADDMMEKVEFGSINYEIHTSFENARDSLLEDKMIKAIRSSIDRLYKGKYNLEALKKVADALNIKLD